MSQIFSPNQAPTGWAELSETLTYASATTITIGTGGAARFAVGDKLRLKQGAGYLYFNVVIVADTLLTITGGSDYTLANAGITNGAISRVVNPILWPVWFNYTPTLTGFSADPTGTSYRFSVDGRKVFLHVRQVNAGTSNASTFTITAPVTSAASGGNWGTMFWIGTDNSTPLTVPGRVIIGTADTTIDVDIDIAGGIWSNSGTKAASFELMYEI